MTSPEVTSTPQTLDEEALEKAARAIYEARNGAGTWYAELGAPNSYECWWMKGARAAILAYRASAKPHGEGWRPIESAPKDGVAFLACVDMWLTICSWNKHRNDWCCVAPGYPSYPSDERPTHWQPLPAPPKKDDET